MHTEQEEQNIAKRVSAKFRWLSLFCSFLVVLLHSGDSDTLKFTAAWYYQMIVPYGLCAAAIPFFFFQSGFFLAGRFEEHGWWQMSLKKRIKSLAVPYIAFALLFVFFKLVVIASANALSGRPVVQNFSVDFCAVLGLDPCRGLDLYVLWYIRALFLLVLLSPVCKWLVEHISSKIVLTCLWLLYALVVPGSETSETEMQSFFKWTVSLLGLFYFSLGIAARRGIVDLKRRFWNVICIVGCATLCVRILTGGVGAHLRPIYCLGLFNVFWRLAPCAPAPKGASRLSFAVYLLHPFFLVILGIAMKHQTCGGFGMFASGVVVFAACSIFAMMLNKTMPRIAFALFGGR